MMWVFVNGLLAPIPRMEGVMGPPRKMWEDKMGGGTCALGTVWHAGRK